MTYPRDDSPDRRLVDADEDPEVPELTDEESREVTSEPVETEDGRSVRVAQQNMGSEGAIGGGEFPDPDTPPAPPAPGGDGDR